MIELTESRFWENSTWGKPIPTYRPGTFRSSQWVDLFDQDGYRLSFLEQEYSQANSQLYTSHADEKSLRKIWMKQPETTTGAHINHALLFERKGYSGEALEQLKKLATENNLIYKLINYRGKWGVDFNLDYVNAEGTVFELYHYEYDSFSFDEISEIKESIEKLALNTDWNNAAKELLKRKDEWWDLDVFQQSDWKSDFFGVKSDARSQRPVDKYKLITWE